MVEKKTPLVKLDIRFTRIFIYSTLMIFTGQWSFGKYAERLVILAIDFSKIYRPDEKEERAVFRRICQCSTHFLESGGF